MKQTVITLLVSIAMNFSITDVLAQAQEEPYSQMFSQTALSENDQKVLSALQRAYPQNRIRLARKTPAPNFYEVILGEGVSYVFITPDTLEHLDTITTQNRDQYFRHWIFGGVFYDMQKLIDLTAPVKTLAQMIDVTKLPLQNAITRERGKPQNTLYVFTDPRCPFCKKLEAELIKFTDIRIHTFLTPLTSLHPDAKELSARIWCAKDKGKAFEDLMLGDKTLEAPAKCVTPLTDNEKLMAELGIKGTPTLFFENGERVTGAISADQIKDKLKRLSQIKKTIESSIGEKKQ